MRLFVHTLRMDELSPAIGKLWRTILLETCQVTRQSIQHSPEPYSTVEAVASHCCTAQSRAVQLLQHSRELYSIVESCTAQSRTVQYSRSSAVSHSRSRAVQNSRSRAVHYSGELSLSYKYFNCNIFWQYYICKYLITNL